MQSGLQVVCGVSLWALHAFATPLFASPDPDLLSFEIDGSVAYLDGFIDGPSSDVVKQALESHSHVDTLFFGWMPGSWDDDANLDFARWVHDAEYTTAYGEGSVVESGAVDLFLAGATRIGHCDAEIGVHGWIDNEGFGPQDIASDDPYHDRYLDYFDDIGVDGAFYWFTINAAAPEDMHYMSYDEIAQYKILTQPLTCG